MYLLEQKQWRDDGECSKQPYKWRGTMGAISSSSGFQKAPLELQKSGIFDCDKDPICRDLLIVLVLAQARIFDCLIAHGEHLPPGTRATPLRQQGNNDAERLLPQAKFSRDSWQQLPALMDPRSCNTQLHWQPISPKLPSFISIHSPKPDFYQVSQHLQILFQLP